MNIFCTKTWVTGTKLKTKHVIFCTYTTGCVFFGFRIRKLKTGVSIRLFVNSHIKNETRIPVEEYKNTIKQLKIKNIVRLNIGGY